MKQITILGATGSIGESALKLVRERPDLFEIYGMTAHSNAELLISLAREFCPKIVVISDLDYLDAVKTALNDLPISVEGGSEALNDVAEHRVDVVVGGIVGFAGVMPLISAVKAGQTIALANKESLVAAGHIIMPLVSKYHAVLLPIDSEHNAIFQCLTSHNKSEIKKITLTASGGAFRDFTPADMLGVTPQQALKHPNWTMGPKVTIDSATLMNKGLELIEAAWLFDLGRSQIDAVIHPQSLVHGMVSYVDGSILAQMGPADMRVPISYALAYPDRLDWNAEHLDIEKLDELEFRAIDNAQFPAFSLARDTIGAAPAKAISLNAANEVAVAAFLAGRIPFVAISKLVSEVLNADIVGGDGNIESVIALDEEARAVASQILEMQF